MDLSTEVENSICRLCASQSGQMIGFYSAEGISNELSEKINTYLPINVNVDDHLPLQSCTDCTSILLNWHNLVITSVESDQKFKSLRILTAAKKLEEETLLTTIHTDSDEELATPSDLLTTSPNDYCQHGSSELFVDQVSTTKPKSIKREYITVLETSTATANAEVENHVVDVKVETIEGRLTTPSTAECCLCPAVLPNGEELSEHMRRCHRRAVREPRLKTVKRVNKEMLRAARVVIDDNVYYRCSECGKSLHSPYTFAWHMRIHTGEKPYVCDLCGKQFRVSQGLARHLKETHERVRPFTCDVCQRSFATRRNVIEHRRIHTDERPYVCDTCGKQFKQKASLFVHKQFHDGHLPYGCDRCDLRFRNQSALQTHRTKHTGERPHKCASCGKTFRIKYEMKRHQLVHSESKPFECQMCGTAFRQKRYLRNHMKNNHATT